MNNESKQNSEQPAPAAVRSSDGLEHHWRTPPPGTKIVTTGRVQKGDWFYIEQLGAWGLVPKIGWGEQINGTLIARGETIWSEVDTSRCSNESSSPATPGGDGGAQKGQTK
jgi:hypothetical protein